MLLLYLHYLDWTPVGSPFPLSSQEAPPLAFWRVVLLFQHGGFNSQQTIWVGNLSPVGFNSLPVT